MLSALAAAKQLPQLSLLDALELTVLVARKDPGRHQRVAARARSFSLAQRRRRSLAPPDHQPDARAGGKVLARVRASAG